MSPFGVLPIQFFFALSLIALLGEVPGLHTSLISLSFTCMVGLLTGLPGCSVASVVSLSADQWCPVAWFGLSGLNMCQPCACTPSIELQPLLSAELLCCQV